MRLSVDGYFRRLLRGGCSDDDLAAELLAALQKKPARHDFRENPGRVLRVMASTGG